ncbi:hypothetical protein JG688_00018229, partial [Phytophthora aleatoria]
GIQAAPLGSNSVSRSCSRPDWLLSVLKRVLSRRFRDQDREDSDETGSVSVRPYSDEIKGGTLIEACSRQGFVVFIIANANDSTVKAFQGILQDALKEDERELIKSLEKLLLDDTLAEINI